MRLYSFGHNRQSDYQPCLPHLSGEIHTNDTFPMKELLEMTKSRAVAMAYTVSEDKVYD
jgi:hypothetical protein